MYVNLGETVNARASAFIFGQEKNHVCPPRRRRRRRRKITNRAKCVYQLWVPGATSVCISDP